MKDTLHTALQELARMVKNEIILRLHSSVGINQRVGRNTLIGSNLEKSISVKPDGENAIVFSIADYYQWVVTGWKRTGHGKGTFQEYLMNIKDWIRRKNIKWGDYTENQMMWILAKRMFSVKHPYTIAARPFINYDENGDIAKILPFLDEFFDKWADDVFEDIMNSVDDYFK